MILTEEEIIVLLKLLAEHTTESGFGYSSDPIAGPLQAKLSIMLEAKRRVSGAVADAGDPEPGVRTEREGQ